MYFVYYSPSLPAERHALFTLLPSGKRYRSICCRTTRLQSLLKSSSTL